MNDKFSFDKVGKRMPYSVPDDFFAKMEDNILEEINGETPNRWASQRRSAPSCGGLSPLR